MKRITQGMSGVLTLVFGDTTHATAAVLCIRRRRPATLLALLVAALVAAPADGAVFMWTGMAGDGWDQGPNWFPGGIPDGNDYVSFMNASPNPVVYLNGSRSVLAIDFGAPVDYELRPEANTDTLTLIDGDIFSSGLFTFKITSDILMLDTGEWDIDQLSTVEVSGEVSGNSIEKTGTGTLRLTGGGTVDILVSEEGTLYIDGGSLDLSSEGNDTIVVRDGASASIEGGASVQATGGSGLRRAIVFGPGSDLTITDGASYSGPRLDVGPFTAGEATVTVEDSAQVEITGQIVVGDATDGPGVLNILSGASLTAVDTEVHPTGSVNVDGGTFSTGLLSSPFADTSTISISDLGGSALTVGTNDGSSTFGGVIQDAAGGPGSLTKTGSGTFTPTGTNTYSGGTLVLEGTIGLSDDANLGNSSGELVLDGGTFLYNASFSLATARPVTVGSGGGTLDTSGFNPTFAPAINGDGRLTKTGAGTLTLTGGGTVGTLVSEEGTLSIDGGSLDLTGSDGKIAVTNGASVRIEGGANVQGTDGSGLRRIVVFGPGSNLTITDGASYNGPRLDVGPFVAGTATVTVEDNAQVDITGPIVIGHATEGPGVLNILSDASLTASNTVMRATGSLNVNGGTFSTGGLSSSGSTASTVSISDPVGVSALTISGGPSTFDGLIQNAAGGSGSLTKTGGGTFTLTGANTYDGGTIINGGTLLANNTTGSATGTGPVTVDDGGKLSGTGSAVGSVKANSGGTVAPGVSAGILTVNDVVFEGGSTFAAQLAGSGGVPGTDFDQLIVNGTATINAGSTLDIRYINPFTAGPGDSFVILDAETLSGTFGTVTFPDGQNWSVNYDTGTGTVTLSICLDDDGDLVCNDDDICLDADDNLDADNDGVPDGCDVCRGFDDNGPDADNDSVPDGCDVCPGLDDNVDTNGDGVADGCAVLGADWDPATGGVAAGALCGSSVSITPIGDGGPSTSDLSGANYSAAPLSSAQKGVNYGAATEWTATFDPPISDLLLYTYFWRGPGAGGPDPISYTFDQPFTILSGLSDASKSGNTLLAPQGQWHNGIIRFTGPVSSLSATTSATNTGAGQGLTFGVVGLDADSDGVPDDCDVCPGFDDTADADVDGVPDGCDACAGGAASGDTDADGNVDLDDYANFNACLVGLGTGCECFDFDGDDGNDLKDFGVFQVNFTGN